MKKKSNLFYLLLIAVLPFLYSCEAESTDPVVVEQARYSNGVLVVNQGQFGGANGTLDFYDLEEEALTRNVYEKENQEQVGGIIEDIAFYEDHAYIITNAADKIIVTDADSLNEVATITDADLITPRYFTASGDKGYVSVWGPYEEDYSLKNSKVAVLDLNSQTLLNTISVPAGPEGIIALNNKIFVANSFTDTITVIDTQTDAVIEKIKTPASPKQFLVDADENLWVVYGNGIAQINPSTYEETRSLTFEDKALSGKTQLIGSTLYFHTSRWNADYTETINAIYKIDLAATNPAEALVLERDNLKTFGINPETYLIYAGIGMGADPGTIVVFDQDGKELRNFAANLFPYEIIFR